MRSVWSLSFAIAATVAAAGYNVGHGAPLSPHSFTAITPESDIQLAQEVYRGPRGGEVYRGPRGGEVYRGPRGGEVYRGPHGGYRVGQRYYGGVWYGTGRRYWNGRWWPYGVGECWRPSPIGFVWVCG